MLEIENNKEDCAIVVDNDESNTKLDQSEIKVLRKPGILSHKYKYDERFDDFDKEIREMFD